MEQGPRGTGEKAMTETVSNKTHNQRTEAIAPPQKAAAAGVRQAPWTPRLVSLDHNARAQWANVVGCMTDTNETSGCCTGEEEEEREVK